MSNPKTSLALPAKPRRGRPLALPEGTIRTLAESCGGLATLARTLNLSRGTLANWAKNPATVPHDWQEFLASLCQAWKESA